MSMERQKLYAEVLRLSSRDRADLAAKLIRSLDDDDEELTPEEWEASWSQEIDRRIAHEQRYGKGTAKSQAVIKELAKLKLFVQARYAYYRDR